jgi:hypothetical protein
VCVSVQGGLGSQCACSDSEHEGGWGDSARVWAAVRQLAVTGVDGERRPMVAKVNGGGSVRGCGCGPTLVSFKLISSEPV